MSTRFTTGLRWGFVPAAAVLLGMAAVIAVTAQAPEPLEDPIPQPIAEGAITIELEPVADGLTAPNWGTHVPGCPALAGWLVVVDQDGILWAVDTGTGAKSVLLDVSGLLVPLGAFGPGTFDERGFLGVAFHPDFASNGLLYTYTSEPVDGPADFSTMEGATPNHQAVVREWQKPAPCDPATVVDQLSSREILRVDEPQFNHNAGALNFDDGGNLYVAFGDGGNADDQGPGHVPGGNGQDPSNILGSIIRIDPLGDDSANGQYGIPEDNPLLRHPTALDEIYAYGFRNPFRFSFDSKNGDMYIGDVGQGAIEEVDIGVAGGNYGWRLKEGSFCFEPNGDEPGFVYECPRSNQGRGRGGSSNGLIDPVAEYDHDEGIAIVGGFVYRGDDIPQLKGRYVFGDFFLPSLGSGRLFYLQGNQVREFQIAGMETLGMRLLGFGQDAGGELYVLANAGGVPFGDTGVVLRIASDSNAPSNFHATLSGANEVPPVSTRARGQAKFQVAGDESSMDYEVVVNGLSNIVAAHVHCAPAGVNGPIGVTIYMGPPLTVNGVLTSGTVMAPDAGNACGWTTIADVKDAMEAGNAYVNVHTQANPAGAIRGQVQ